MKKERANTTEESYRVEVGLAARAADRTLGAVIDDGNLMVLRTRVGQRLDHDGQRDLCGWEEEHVLKLR